MRAVLSYISKVEPSLPVIESATSKVALEEKLEIYNSSNNCGKVKLIQTLIIDNNCHFNKNKQIL